jgi:hypothetical protein
MSYLGTVDQKNADIKHYSLTGSTLTTVDIGWVPPSEQSLRVTINGVVQQGGTFSLSGSNLTLGGALVATDDLEVVGIQSVGNLITPADNSVSTAKLADDSVTLAKMAGLARGKIIVGDASGNPSALTVGASTQILTSDGTDAAWAAAPAGGIAASEMKGFTKRPVFEWLSTTTIGLQGDFVYQHNGTTTQLVSGANVTFTRSDTSGTEQWNYIYLDDSAIVTAGNSTITSSQLISSPTAPTLNTTKGGFYNGNDRCIYAFKQNASDEILRFSKIQQMGSAVGTVLNNFSWTFESSSGSAYGTSWHWYTATTDYLPRPCGVQGLCIGAFINLGGSHAGMYVADNVGSEYDMFAVASPWDVNAPVSNLGAFGVRLDYAHSSYTQTFKLIGWIMSPLL